MSKPNPPTVAPPLPRGVVDAMIRRAASLQRAGRMAEAEALYRGSLRLAPGERVAMHNLGVLLGETDRPTEAVVMLELACAGDPAAASLDALGVNLAALARFDEAIARQEQACAMVPGDADFANNLASTLLAAGHAARAEAMAAAALALDPGHAKAHYIRGRLDAEAGLHADAVTRFERALEGDAAFADAHQACGLSLVALKRQGVAAGHFAAVLRVRPDDRAAMHHLARTLADLERWPEAVPHLERLAVLEPDDPHRHVALAAALLAVEDFAGARRACERALAIDPAFSPAHTSLGSMHQMLGDLATGLSHLARAVDLAPTNMDALHAFAEAHTFAPDDPRFADLLAREMLSGDLDDERQRIALQFALGKAHDDVGNHDRAFAHWTKGNAMKRATLAYDENATAALFRAIADVFTPDLLASKRGLGHASTKPVFIVGMPRSGTTLAEQVLASHPDVHGCGELPFVQDAARALSRHGAHPFPGILRTLDAATLEGLGAAIVARMAKADPQAAKVTDKMPANFQYLGFLHLLLPSAKIVHVRRDPLDTCLSCYTKLFGTGQPFSYDLGELGRHYVAYARLMAHWRAVLPEGAMLDVDYEALVADFEPQVRRLLAHCGLTWHPACQEFHRTQRAVRTASLRQVRRPLYASSVRRADRYKRWLDPLRAALRDGGIDCAPS